LSESRIVELEKVLERHPGVYDKATIKSVRDLVTYVEENDVPQDKIPYDDFEDFPEFSLYLNLTPEWRHKPKESLRNDEKYGGKYFIKAMKRKCTGELGLSDYEAEYALDSLIYDFNKGIVTSNLSRTRPVDAARALGAVQKSIQDMKDRKKRH